MTRKLTINQYNIVMGEYFTGEEIEALTFDYVGTDSDNNDTNNDDYYDLNDEQDWNDWDDAYWKIIDDDYLYFDEDDYYPIDSNQDENKDTEVLECDVKFGFVYTHFNLTPQVKGY
jgi:hypothetical protein